MKLKINIFGFDKVKYLLISLGFIPITMLVRNFTSNYVLIIIVGIIVNVIYYFSILLINNDKLTYEIIKNGKNRIGEMVKMIK